MDTATGEILAPKAKKKKPAKKTGPKPRTASLFKSMDLAEIDLDTALRLLDLPRIVGKDPESGEDITAQNGRYGPYLKKGADTRSLPEEDLIFEIDLAGALELYAQPKYGARRASSALKEFEADPESGKPIKVKDGRFGPYVTDGVTNATIPRGETVDEVDFDRAVQLLADKRAKGPAKPKRAPAKRKPPSRSRRRRAQRRRQWRRRRLESDGVSGLFLTFEGGDGSGKSTQARLLTQWLTDAGHPVLHTREPGGTDLGVELRNIVLHRRGHIAPRAEALIYAADRAHHIATTVKPALERGDIVVQDRYLDSSVAYQGDGRELEAEEVRGISLWAAGGLMPDLTFLLDLDRDGRPRPRAALEYRLRPAGGRRRRLPRSCARRLPASGGGRAHPLRRARCE